MNSLEIKALAKKLGWEEYDYFGPVTHGEFVPPKHLILKCNTILAGHISVSKIDTNGFRLLITGTIDFDQTEIIGNQLIGK